MRWIVLALSLGASVTSIIHGVLALLLSFPGKEGGGSFSWLTGALLIFSALLALIGGVMAFNRRRMGGLFLIVSAAICLFAHPDVRVYGGLYAAGGLIAFLLRPGGRYDEEDDYDEYDEENDDEDDYEDEESARDEGAEEMPEPLPRARRRESAARISEGVRQSVPEDVSLGNHKVRVRKSKTCPTCGATAAIHHKFCPNCGAQLHVPSYVLESDMDTLEETEASSVVSDGEAEALDREKGQTSSVFDAPSSESAFVADRAATLTVGELGESKRLFVKPRPVLGDDLSELSSSEEPEGELEKPKDVRPLEHSFEEEPFLKEAVEPVPTHKVFVTPLRDEGPIPHRSVNIGPDASYAEFSRYSRRRKRRQRSLFRRFFGMVVLLAVVGGAAWFLLGLRKLPVKDLPVPPPLVTESDVPALPSGDVIAEPINGRGGRVGLLPPLSTGESPKRGVVLGSNVNLREDHSTASKSVARLNLGAGADILEQWEGVSGTLSGVWYRVRTVASKEGWMYGDYFLPLRESSLPEGYTAVLMEGFGTTKSGAVGKLGQPARSAAASLSWPGISLFLKADQVVKIQVTDARHPLVNGVVVGMPAQELYRAMGYPSSYNAGQLRYRENDKVGVLIRLKNGKVQSVTLEKPTI